jgi:hypothetical protein
MGESVYNKNMENVHREYEKYVENIDVIMKYMYTVHERNIYWANISQGFVVSNGNLLLVRISFNKLH